MSESFSSVCAVIVTLCSPYESKSNEPLTESAAPPPLSCDDQAAVASVCFVTVTGVLTLSSIGLLEASISTSLTGEASVGIRVVLSFPLRVLLLSTVTCAIMPVLSTSTTLSHPPILTARPPPFRDTATGANPSVTVSSIPFVESSQESRPIL